MKLFGRGRPEVFCKKVFLEFHKILRKTPVLESLFKKESTLLKKRLWHRCFPANFVKFLRTPFFTEHLLWLLLVVDTADTHLFAMFEHLQMNIQI